MSYAGPARSLLPPIISSTDEEAVTAEANTSESEAAEVMTTSAAEDRVLESTKVTKYEYIYLGSQLAQMTVTTTVDNGTPTKKTLNFAYDASGIPATVTYDGATYYYITNLQGDVMAILNSSGTAVVQYEYDPWGNHLSITGSMATTLGEANPLRYRGYVYDTESTLYYLQSRYYDPAIGRFINADAYASTGQGVLANNMFAYCGNNPVTRADPKGYDYSTIKPNSSFFYSEVTHIYAGVRKRYYHAGSAWSDFMEDVGAIITIPKAGAAIKNIIEGGLLILAPLPTPTDEIAGAIKMGYGLGALVSNVQKIIVWIFEGGR